MEAKLVSLIIPVYNAEKWIKRCLNSILNNTYTNFEIICVNDGSTDGSSGIIKALQASDDRIKLVSQTNRGVSAARNAGLQQVRGEYVTFVDADDWVHPMYLASLVTCLERYDADIAICDYKNTGEFDPHEMNTTFGAIENVEVYSPRDAMMHFYTKAYVWGKLFTPQYAAAKKECAAVYKKAFSHRSCLRAKEWALYLLLLAFPNLYRAFRISKDKSLLIWEKEKKKRYRPQSKHWFAAR